MGKTIIRTAQDVAVQDVGGFFSSQEVEGALQELGAAGGGGGNATFPQNKFTPTSGQTVFTLSAPFVSTGGLSIVFVNGIGYEAGTDYTISGTTLTWLDVPFTLQPTDCLLVKFQTA